MVTEELLEKPPIPKNKHWLLGHTKAMMGDILNFFAEIQEECGNMVHLTSPVAAGEMYVIYDSDAIKYVMTQNQKNYRKGDLIKILQPLLGNGLITSEGDFWKKQRRLVQPAFYKNHITHMMKVMGESVDLMLDQWDQTYKDGDVVNLFDEFNWLSLKVLTGSLFKIDLGDQVTDISDNLYYILTRYMNRFKNPIAYANWIPSQANRKERSKTKELHKIIEDIISMKKSGEIPHQEDILDMLLAVQDEETGETMSETQIRDELMTIMLAGYETTASAMASMMYHLSGNPEVYQKVDQYITANQLKGAPEDVRKAEYIRQVVSETLRLSPPAFLIQRQAIAEDTINGFHVPAGINIAIPIFNIHRMAEYWEDPELFNPDRFEKEAFKEVPKYAFIPFGGGPRLCVGDQFAMSEAMIALIKIHNKFYFKPNDSFQMEYVPKMSLQTKDPVRLPIYRK